MTREHEGDGLEDEDQAQEREDQNVAGEHVREEPDAERDQAHELAEDLERDDQEATGPSAPRESSS